MNKILSFLKVIFYGTLTVFVYLVKLNISIPFPESYVFWIVIIYSIYQIVEELFCTIRDFSEKKKLVNLILDNLIDTLKKENRNNSDFAASIFLRNIPFIWKAKIYSSSKNIKDSRLDNVEFNKNQGWVGLAWKFRKSLFINLKNISKESLQLEPKHDTAASMYEKVSVQLIKNGEGRIKGIMCIYCSKVHGNYFNRNSTISKFKWTKELIQLLLNRELVINY